MKDLMVKLFAITLISMLGLSFTFAQETEPAKEKVLMRILTNDGTDFIGYILKDDKREVLIKTEEQGEVYIPKYAIKKMEPASADEFIDGKYVGQERFATRYFLTTNGLPIKKGEHYAMLNIYGPEVHFAVSDNFSVGVMSTWVAAPVVGTAKFSFNLGKNANASIGVLAGSSLWAQFGSGALGYGALTFGNRTTNITFSGGYGGVRDSYGNGGGKALASISGMAKITPKVTFIGDSFIFGKTTGETYSNSGALIMGGLRFNNQNGGAFQIGMAAIVIDGEVEPVPIPTFGWFRALN